MTVEAVFQQPLQGLTPAPLYQFYIPEYVNDIIETALCQAFFAVSICKNARDIYWGWGGV